MNKYKHILVATDFSDIAEQASKQASGLAKLLGAKLTLLHVVEHFPEDIPENIIPPENVDPEKFVYKHAYTKLEQLRNTLDPGQSDTDIKVLLSSHSARKEIINFTTQEAIDFIVLGAHGSTASKVSHAVKVDVLLVKTPLKPA